VRTATMDFCQRILDNQATAVVLLDGRLHVIYLNPAAEALFAVSARHTLGLHFLDLIPGGGDMVEQLEQSNACGQPFTEREKRLELPIDRSVTVDYTVTPFQDALPAKPKLLLEIIQVDRQLRISREEHRMAQHHATRALIRGLAHEVKNPLGGLRGAAQLLERELADPNLREYTAVIIAEADRLQNLVDRMLGPRQLPQKRWVNIHEVVEHVRSLVVAEAPSTIELHRDYDPSIPPMFVDAELLIQALLNIVRNGVQALGKKGDIYLVTRVLRQFTIGATRHKLVVRVDVIDNGPGVPPAILERIFFPMVTGRPDGTGLGLSIAQSLVNQHGGFIECSSEPGNTRFTLYLPLELNHERT
jgi:two-component system, NtrC family, nitrogen regulation sensor histidine kinase GlnL